MRPAAAARTMLTVAVALAVAGLAQLWPCNKPGNNLQSQHNLLLLAKEAAAQAEVGSIQKIAQERKKQWQTKTEWGRGGGVGARKEGRK